MVLDAVRCEHIEESFRPSDGIVDVIAWVYRCELAPCALDRDDCAVEPRKVIEFVGMVFFRVCYRRADLSSESGFHPVDVRNVSYGPADAIAHGKWLSATLHLPRRHPHHCYHIDKDRRVRSAVRGCADSVPLDQAGTETPGPVSRG